MTLDEAICQIQANNRASTEAIRTFLRDQHDYQTQLMTRGIPIQIAGNLALSRMPTTASADSLTYEYSQDGLKLDYISDGPNVGQIEFRLEYNRKAKTEDQVKLTVLQDPTNTIAPNQPISLSKALDKLALSCNSVPNMRYNPLAWALKGAISDARQELPKYLQNLEQGVMYALSFSQDFLGAAASAGSASPRVY